MKYCVYCERKVYPMKKINWFIVFILALMSGGVLLLFYLPYHWFIDQGKCPMCGGRGFGPEFVVKKPEVSRVEIVTTQPRPVPNQQQQSQSKPQAQKPDRTAEFIESKLKLLSDMHKDGLITEEEFTKRKTEILDKML